MKPLKIKVYDTLIIVESLFNYKRWFNGLKKFSSVWIKTPKK